MNARSWLRTWNTPDYIQKKHHSFIVLDSYLYNISFKPTTILDIGCGLAIETEMFQQKYKSEIYLLDDDFDNNTETQNRDVFFGPANTLKFYSNLEDLFDSYEKRNLKYNFIYAKNPVIDNNVTFDLIYSNRSYGFHYSVETYMELIKKHSNENTIVVIDMWKETFNEEKQKCNIVEVIENGEQHYKVHIQF